MNLNVSINLLALNGVTIRRGQEGESLLCIDLRYPNGIRQTAKGIYLGLSVWENRNGVTQYGTTHYVKASYSKQERDAMQGQQTPIIGNARPIEPPQQPAAGYAGQPYAQQPAQYQHGYPPIPQRPSQYQQPSQLVHQPFGQQYQFAQTQTQAQRVQQPPIQQPMPAPVQAQGSAQDEEDDDLPF